MGNNLLLRFEEDLYKLRGPSVVSNHPYSLVRQYLYRFVDFTYLPTAFSRYYLLKERDVIRTIFDERKMNNSLMFLDWLLKDLK